MSSFHFKRSCACLLVAWLVLTASLDVHAGQVDITKVKAIITVARPGKYES